MKLAVVAVLALAVQDGGSLDEALRRARTERDAAVARLAEPVARLVERLEGLSDAAAPRELAEVREELDGLDAEAALVLLPYVDPGYPPPPSAEEPDPESSAESPAVSSGGSGEEPGEGAVFRAAEVTAALVRRRAPGLVDELVALAESDRSPARLHAIRILGATPEAARASAFLARLFPSTVGDARLEVAAALARQGGARNAAVLRTALTDDDPKVVRTVLEALAEARSAEAAPAVLNLARVPRAADQVVPAILEYYRRCPDTVGEDELAALVRLAMDGDLEIHDRVAVLETLPAFEASRGTWVRRQVAPLFDESNPALREGALICAALLGERSARRELMRSYDQIVEDNERWPEAYQRRGDAYLRIHDYNHAVRDYRQALDLLGERALQAGYRPIWIGLARAYAGSGKLRQAHDALVDAGLDPEERRELADDADFAPLLENPRYRDVFE